MVHHHRSQTADILSIVPLAVPIRVTAPSSYDSYWSVEDLLATVQAHQRLWVLFPLVLRLFVAPIAPDCRSRIGLVSGLWPFGQSSEPFLRCIPDWNLTPTPPSPQQSRASNRREPRPGSTRTSN